MNLKEIIFSSDDEEKEVLLSVNIAKTLRQKLVDEAQDIYNNWDESNIDVFAGGGICHFIADAICDILNNNNIPCSSVSSCHEQHVYVVAKFIEGVFSIDIPYGIYETGGGFSWKKIKDVQFEPEDITFYMISSDPEDFETTITDY